MVDDGYDGRVREFRLQYYQRQYSIIGITDER